MSAFILGVFVGSVSFPIVFVGICLAIEQASARVQITCGRCGRIFAPLGESRQPALVTRVHARVHRRARTCS